MVIIPIRFVAGVWECKSQGSHIKCLNEGRNWIKIGFPKTQRIEIEIKGIGLGFWAVK